LQRSLQKGRNGLPSHSTLFLQMGQRMAVDQFEGAATSG